MLRGVYDELGLTEEEREQLAREAMEPTMPMPEVEPPPLAPVQKPNQPPAPGPDVELMRARDYDSSRRSARDLKGWSDSFADSVMFSPVGQGYKPVAQPSQRPSAEAQLLGDRAGKAKAAAAAERKAQAELEAKALADYRKMGLDRQAAADKAGEADRAADNARADKELGWKMDPNNPANRPKAAKGKADTSLRDSSELRKEFSGLPEVKSFKEVSTAYDKVQRSAQNPSGAGDLSLIFGFMKMLDPGSTVREGEFKNAATAGGLDDRLEAAFAKVKKGERLSEDQRADFVGRAREMYAAQRAQFDSQRQRYGGLATKYGIDPGDVADDIVEPGAARPADSADGASGKVPMISKTGATIMLDPATAERLLKQGKVRKP